MLQHPRLSETYLPLLHLLILAAKAVTVHNLHNTAACCDAFPRHPALCYRSLQLIFRSITIVDQTVQTENLFA